LVGLVTPALVALRHGTFQHLHEGNQQAIASGRR
jgi:hypothetical protein